LKSPLGAYRSISTRLAMMSESRALRAHLTTEIAPPVTVLGRGRRGDDDPCHVVRQGVRVLAEIGRRRPATAYACGRVEQGSGRRRPVAHARLPPPAQGRCRSVGV